MPSHTCRSAWQTPVATIRTRISSAPPPRLFQGQLLEPQRLAE